MDKGRETGEKRAVSQNHGKSGYEHDSRVRADEDAELGHAASGSIRIGATPGEDGNAIDDEITGTNEPTTESGQDREDKKRFREWCPCALPALALLRRRRDAGTAILAQRQAARQGQSMSKCNVLTKVRASICKAEPSRACAR
jgi:hypothetical protein